MFWRLFIHFRQRRRKLTGVTFQCTEMGGSLASSLSCHATVPLLKGLPPTKVQVEKLVPAWELLQWHGYVNWEKAHDMDSHPKRPSCPASRKLINYFNLFIKKESTGTENHTKQIHNLMGYHKVHCTVANTEVRNRPSEIDRLHVSHLSLNPPRIPESHYCPGFYSNRFFVSFYPVSPRLAFPDTTVWS